MDEKASFFIEGIQVLPSKNQLIRGELIVPLQPKVMGLLIYLARNHERVVNTEELISELWGGRVVSYGTVPKSVTSLRKGLAQFLDSREVVTNYSKKGYQLLIAPSMLNAQPLEEVDTQEVNPSYGDWKVSKQRNWRAPKFLVVASALFVLILGVVVKQYLPLLQNLKEHKINFQDHRGFTNETGHERVIVPHKDGSHFAYIRDDFGLSDFEQNHSSIILRDLSGEKWKVATTPGSWFKLAWSNTSNLLLAVEVTRNKGKPLTTNFYEVADYFYSIVVFELDLTGKRVISKKVVSHWQGRIMSASWWGESSIEIVARQGIKATPSRYRIDVSTQRVQKIKFKDAFLPPLASSVRDGRVAVAYEKSDGIEVVVYDEKGDVLTAKEFKGSKVNLSWKPDGSGILVFLNYEKMGVLYLNGQVEEINTKTYKDRSIYGPVFSSDGQSIFVTEKILKTNIWTFLPDGETIKITNNNSYNYLPVHSNSGNKIAYVSVRNDQAQIWIIEGEEERQIVAVDSNRILNLVWMEDDTELLYRTGENIFLYDLNTKSNTKIVDNAEHVRPLSLIDSESILVGIKISGKQSNLWTISLTENKERQLTYGSLGAVKLFDGIVYFQYENKEGLWAVDPVMGGVKVMVEKFPRNTVLLQVTNEGAYYITGARCRESGIYFYNFTSKESSVFQVRDSSLVVTSSFDSDKGSLGWPCFVPESNIVEYF